MLLHSFESEIAYLKSLIGAGFKGIASAQPVAGVNWTPALVGAAVGALGGRAFARRKSSSSVTASLVGTIVGGGVVWAWSGRAAIRPALRQSARLMTEVRDARWLAAHPIDYA